MTKEELKYIQKELGFTVEKMAQALNVPKATYETWLYGQNEMPNVYQHILKGMYQAIKKQRSDELKTAIGLGLAGLGAFALALLVEKNNKNEDENSFDED